MSVLPGGLRAGQIFKGGDTIKKITVGNNLVRPDYSKGGIFWNKSLGVISLSRDGVTWKTIADKNLGATKVWKPGDTVDYQNNGYVYQWGNNYPFTVNPNDTIVTDTTRVDITGYGPGNYYSSSTFITGSDGWIANGYYNLNNHTLDLRGDDTDTDIARQGPCPSGWHIPSIDDWNELIYLLSYEDGWSGMRWNGAGVGFKPIKTDHLTTSHYFNDNIITDYLLIPSPLGRKNTDASIQAMTFTDGSLLTRPIKLWNSHGYAYANGEGLYYEFGGDAMKWRRTPTVGAWDGVNTGLALPIRPFKNNPIIPSGDGWECLWAQNYSWKNSYGTAGGESDIILYTQFLGEGNSNLAYEGVQENSFSRVYVKPSTAPGGSYQDDISNIDKTKVTYVSVRWKVDTPPRQQEGQVQSPYCYTGGVLLDRQHNTAGKYDCFEYYTGSAWVRGPQLGLQADIWYRLLYGLDRDGNLAYRINGQKTILLAAGGTYTSENKLFLYRCDKTGINIHMSDIIMGRKIPSDDMIAQYWEINKNLYGY